MTEFFNYYIQLYSSKTKATNAIAFCSFLNGKACVPDGYGIEFFKAHVDTNAPLLLHMISCSVKDEIFPNTLYDTKEDDANVASYCPK